MHGRVEHLLPEFLAGDGELPDLLHAVIIERLAAVLLKELDIFVDLPAHVFLDIRIVPGMAEGRVQNEQRYIEIPGLDFIPFQDGPADIVAAHEHVGFWKPADRPSVDGGAGNVRAGIGAQVAGIAHGFGLLVKPDAHAAGADHGPVILGINGNDIHHDQGLHGAAARDPGDLLARLSGRLGVDVIGRHDVLHRFDGLDLSFLFFRIRHFRFFRHFHLLYSISKKASKRVRNCPSGGS